MFKKEYQVDETMTAVKIGSGDLEVLATPALIACVENTCKEFVASDLTAAETTVGSFIEIKHLRPTKVGQQIQVVLTGFEKERQLHFTFEVLEGEKMIAVGKHQRAIVEIETFLNRG